MPGRTTEEARNNCPTWFLHTPSFSSFETGMAQILLEEQLHKRQYQDYVLVWNANRSSPGLVILVEDYKAVRHELEAHGIHTINLYRDAGAKRRQAP